MTPRLRKHVDLEDFGNFLDVLELPPLNNKEKDQKLPEFGGAIIEGGLEVKLPTTWADGQAEVGRVREEKRKEEK